MWLAWMLPLAAAADVDSHRFHIEHWDTSNGLPSNALQASVVDTDGYVWVATSQGLARFDGRHWRTFDSRNTPEMSSSEVRSVFVRNDGTLIVALASGRVLARTAGVFRILLETAMPIASMQEEPDGSLLLAGFSVFRLRPNGASEIVLQPNPALDLRSLFALPGRILAYANASGFQAVSGRAGAMEPAWQIAPVSGDGLLVTVERNVVWLLGRDQRWRVDPRGDAPIPMHHDLPFHPKAIAQGPDGRQWIAGGGNQIALCSTPDLASGAPCEPMTGIPTTHITHLQRDASGALWISSWDAGLFRVTAPPIRLYGSASELPGRPRALAVLNDGSVLVGTQTGAVHIDGELRQLLSFPAAADPSDSVLSLAQMPDGRILRGRRRGIDIASPPSFANWREMGGTLTPAPMAYALYVDAKGSVWAADARILHWVGSDWTVDDPHAQLIYAFVTDASGTLWAAGGAALRQDSTGRFVDAGAPRPRGRFKLMSALKDSRGHLWFGGYECGVYRYDGREWLHLDTTRGLPDDTAYGLVEDAQQRLWISHGRGLYTLALSEGDRLAADPSARAQVRAYSGADGVPVTGFNGGSGLAAAKDGTGSLWFVSDDGAVRVEPARLPQPLARPRVLIDQVSIDDQSVTPGESLALKPGAESLNLTLRAPAPGAAARVAVRYRLDPLQPDWLPLPDSGEIEYQRLPPGRFTLKAQSAIDQRDWSDALQLPVEQAPFWWQRRSAWVAGALLLVLGAGMIGRWRMAALAVRNRRLQALVEQRGQELASEREQLLLARATQAETDRELLWFKRHRALEEWSALDPAARAAYVALAAVPHPQTRSDLSERLAAADPDYPERWRGAEYARVIERLVALDCVQVDAHDSLRAAKADWALLPDTQLPLAELVARASPRIGAYRLLERIGEGAMGEVFRAVSIADGSLAALKLVHRDASSSADTRRRLEREGEIVSTLSHPNIVRLLERGEQEGRLYLAMEFLTGQTLQARLAAADPLPRAHALRIVGDLAQALAALHGAGVIHRDLHPGNVMILADGRAKLLDFGLARAASTSTLTRANTVLGSLPYLAPELLSGEPASAASDLFALGAIACECLCGRRLWHGVQTLELVIEIARFEGPDRTLLQGLEPALGALISGLLERDARRRGSACALIERLQQVALASTAHMDPQLSDPLHQMPHPQAPAG